MKSSKTIYINEQSLNGNLLNEIKLPSELSSGILDKLAKNEVLSGSIAGIKEDEKNTLFKKFLKSGLNDSRKELIDNGAIEGVDGTDLNSALSKLVTEASKREKAQKDKLEKMCVNSVIELFSIPEDSMVIEAKLVGSIKSSESVFRLSPDDTEYSYKDYKEASSMNDFIGRKHISNMLSCGAAEYFAERIIGSEEFKENLEDDELCGMYRSIMKMNNYLLYTKEGVELTEENKNELGYSIVRIGNDVDLTSVEARAQIFPVLLYEMVKGMIELFTSFCLPDKMDLAYSVMKKTDCVENELWYMRFGNGLWKVFNSTYGESNYESLPYVLKRITALPKMKFNRIWREILYGTEKAEKLIKRAKDDVDFMHFKEKMKAKSIEKNIIEDEYTRQ